MLDKKTKKSRLHAPYDFLFVCWLFCTLFFFSKSSLLEITQWRQTSPYRLTDLLVPTMCTWLVVRKVRDKVARKLIRCALCVLSLGPPPPPPIVFSFFSFDLLLYETRTKNTLTNTCYADEIEAPIQSNRKEWGLRRSDSTQIIKLTLNSLNKKVNRYSIFILIMWFNQAGLFSYSISASYSRDVCREM